MKYFTRYTDQKGDDKDVKSDVMIF